MVACFGKVRKIENLMSLKSRIAASRKGHRVRKRMMAARANANQIRSSRDLLARLRFRMMVRKYVG
jgi:hypothetical protein